MVAEMNLGNESLRRLWRHREIAGRILAHNRMAMIFCVFLSLLLTLFELLRPQPTRILFDAILTRHPHSLPRVLRNVGIEHWSRGELLTFVCSSVLLLGVGTGLVNYLLEVRLAYLGNKVVSRLRKVVFRHLLALPSLFYDSQQTGDVVLRLTGDIIMIRDLAVDFIVSFVGRSTLVFGLGGMMLWMNLRLGLVALALMPILAWIAARATAEVRSITRDQRRKESDVAQSIHEIIGEMRVFAAYGRRDLEDERFDGRSRSSFRDDVKGRRVRARLAGIGELTLAAGICAVFGLGTYEILNERMTPGELLVFLSYQRTLFKPIRSLVALMGRTGKAIACTERVLDILDTPLELANSPDAIHAPPLRGEVVFDRVSLTYGGKASALRGVSLRFEPGEIVGLCGPSGAGKSSLCMLLPRLYDPDEGTVLLDGTDIRRFTLESLRPQVGLVLQDSGLFDLTVAGNVAFGLTDWTPEDVAEACMAAGIHETILGLPSGYETLIGERGAKLSGGQRRRLAIARALVRKPRILILDEPFEGLDHATAAAIGRTILALASHRTVFIVSHHPQHLAGCTRIVRMEGGRVFEGPVCAIEEVPSHA